MEDVLVHALFDDDFSDRINCFEFDNVWMPLQFLEYIEFVVEGLSVLRIELFEGSVFPGVFLLAKIDGGRGLLADDFIFGIPHLEDYITFYRGPDNRLNKKKNGTLN